LARHLGVGDAQALYVRLDHLAELSDGGLQGRYALF
jgi:hypothetical protein